MICPSLLNVVSVKTLFAIFCTGPGFAIASEQFLRIGEGGLGDVASTQHLRYLAYSLLLGEFRHVGTCALWGFFLQHLVVMSAHGGNLWQVGDGDDLAVEFAHLCHAPLIIALSESITRAISPPEAT